MFHSRDRRVWLMANPDKKHRQQSDMVTIKVSICDKHVYVCMYVELVQDYSVTVTCTYDAVFDAARVQI